MLEIEVPVIGVEVHHMIRGYIPTSQLMGVLILMVSPFVTSSASPSVPDRTCFCLHFELSGLFEFSIFYLLQDAIRMPSGYLT